MAFARKITVHPEVQTIIDTQVATDKRLVKFWAGLQWRLARGPLHGAYRIPESEPPTYVIRQHHWGVASLIVTYRFDAVEVLVVDLFIEPVGPGSAAVT
jgi:hypothetical protein